VRISRAATLAAAIIVVAGGAAAYVVHRHHTTATPVAVQTPAALPTTAAPREPVLGSLDNSAPQPTAAGVAAGLRTASGTVSLGAHLVGDVVDGRTGTRLWSASPDQPEPPASTTKLMTAAAALAQLGPDHRLTTTSRRSGHTVYLVGGGDPTIVRDSSSYVSPAYPQPATLSQLARQTAAALAGTKKVRLRLDTSAWTGPTMARGWKPNYVTEGDVTPPSALELDEGRIDPQSPTAARTNDPAAQAGAAFADLLRTDGVRVIGKPTASTAPARSRPLASVSSPPVAALVQRMLTVSDDDLAEALGRAVAQRDHRPPTFAGAARAVTAAVSSLGVKTRGVSLKDTSGLSHQDRITPRVLVGVLRAAISPGYPQLRPMLEGLPVAGLTGTLADRYLNKPTDNAAGVLRAKTGTLTGVNTLAGVVVDRAGRLLVFAFLASDAHSPGLTVPGLDRMGSRLEHCGCG
jgi:D-alanyl-D-alanine carboxypeptidase/D-alanyl-D-alanine-endopeptidase (penicillin-binding protein 4)